MNGPPQFFARALVAFLVLPGVVAYALPLLVLRPQQRTPHVIGMLVAGLGTVMLLICVREFYVAGRGTLASWWPPERLVTDGLYRYTRNPMYVAVLTILAGWALGYGTRGLTIYALAIAVVFHLRVVWFEEPWLARAFGEDFSRYAAATPRWLMPARRNDRWSDSGRPS